MATYFERMRAGMQATGQLLQELEPGMRHEWGPMDNDANYPLIIVRGNRKVLLCRFSKDSLVAMSDEPHQFKVREELRLALRTGTRVTR